MSRKKKKKKRGPRHTPLANLKKKGSKLVGPLDSLPIKHLSWDRDLLPEHLWIGGLAARFGIEHFHKPFNTFLDAVDEFWPKDQKSVCLGLVSDFELFPTDARKEFVEKHRDLAVELFWKPIGEALSMYPVSPARWLCDALRDPAQSLREPDALLSDLRGVVREMLGGRDEFATRVRVVPFVRPLKNERMLFAKDMPVLDLLPRYPNDLSQEQKGLVESFIRASMMAQFGMMEHLESHGWPQTFWRKNFDLTLCRPLGRAVPGGFVATDSADLEGLQRSMDAAARAAGDYLEGLHRIIRLDLYDPRRDEVLIGLFARTTRLFVLLLRDPNLWARDIAGIMLRCLADTAITFAYLAKTGTPDAFEQFIQYGEGQQKLLMLHLQDSYSGDRSPDGHGIEDLEGRFSILPEFVDIELGHWAKKDARRLAKEAGMERLYDLVFSPASSDVHGTWLALRNSHLTYCQEALHRYHRLPTLADPPFFVAVVDTARQLYEECRSIARRNLGFPDSAAIPPFVAPDPADDVKERAGS